ncbi:MAG TPA: CHC2 zinc finger domain-containing protein [Roseiarcus sp.]|nr:CHC2 zinc finger domain-containing protein [Roseiarcus sp.]
MIPSDLIERASAVRIEDEVERRGIKLVGRIDRSGPCPLCGGKDRFSINTRKQVFRCRGCVARGNVIALVRFLDGCSFLEALEYLTGERAPAPSMAVRARSTSFSSARTTTGTFGTSSDKASSTFVFASLLASIQERITIAAEASFSPSSSSDNVEHVRIGKEKADCMLRECTLARTCGFQSPQ